MIPSVHQRGRSWLYVSLVFLLASPVALAGTTGNLTGYVTGPNNAPVQGVRVTVSGPALQGSKVATTDAQGFFRLTQLPPGDDYRARFESSGFKTTERTGIIINIDSTIKLPTIRLAAVTTETAIEVVEEAPVVEQGSTSIGRTLTNEFLSAVPTGRTTTAVLALAPGASSDALGVTFRGATSPENSYVIDGLNTTGVLDGLPTSELPPEFIQEIQVKTGGYEPEYGRATGGQAIVITKSGGNEFHGDIFGYITPLYGQTHRVVDGEDDPSTSDIQEAAIISQRQNQLYGQVGFDIGGYIIKDRLWFFVGYAPTVIQQRVGHEIRQLTAEEEASTEVLDPVLGDNAIYERYRSMSHFYLANVTFNLSQDHSVRLSASGNPFSSSGARLRPSGDPGTYNATERAGAMDFNLTYNGKFLGGKANLDFIVGYHTERDDFQPFTGTYTTLSGNSAFENTDIDGSQVVVLHNIPYPATGTDTQCGGAPCYVYGYRTGGVGYINRTSADRLVVKPVLSIFLNNFVGNHVFKLGGDFERNHLVNARTYTGGRFVTERATSWLEQWFSEGGEPVLWYGADNEDSYFNAETYTMNASAFAQDSWSILSNLSLSLGLRWEQQRIQDRFGHDRIVISDSIAPRLGLIFDYTNQGKSKLFANFGRYYESVPQDINDRALSTEGFNFYRYRFSQYPDYVPGEVDPSEETLVAIFGGEQTPVQADLKGQYSDQFLVGYEQEVATDLSAGITLIYQRLGNVIEDISPDNGGTYLIANPGAESFNYLVVPSSEDADGNLVYDWEADSVIATDDTGTPIEFRRCLAAADPLTGGPVTYCFPKASRTYQAVELTLNKRLSDNWTAQASYTLSQTYGNYPGLFSPTNGQLDPNITSQFDLPNLLVNRDGYLDLDRRHNFKLAGAYLFNFGTSLGLTASLQSGAPINYLGSHPLYGDSEGFILPRGIFPEDAVTDTSSEDYVPPRTPGLVQIDANANHTLTFANKRSLRLGVQVNNILNAQAALRLDQNYTLDVVNPATGGTKISEVQCYDAGTFAAVAQCTRNPTFGNAITYQAPFNVRFEAKFSF